MKVINVTELKSHLSKSLRLASRGTRVTVQDPDEPIYQRISDTNKLTGG